MILTPSLPCSSTLTNSRLLVPHHTPAHVLLRLVRARVLVILEPECHPVYYRIHFGQPLQWAMERMTRVRQVQVFDRFAVGCECSDQFNLSEFIRGTIKLGRAVGMPCDEQRRN